MHSDSSRVMIQVGAGDKHEVESECGCDPYYECSFWSARDLVDGDLPIIYVLAYTCIPPPTHTNIPRGNEISTLNILSQPYYNIFDYFIYAVYYIV